MVIGIELSDANRKQKTGTEWYAHELLRAILKHERDETLRLYSAEPLEGELAELPHNAKSVVLAWPPRRLWTQLRLSFEMLAHAPDVLFVPAHVIPLFHPHRTVTTIHDIGFERFPSVYPTFELLYLRFSVQFALRTGTQVIVPSRFVKDEMLDRYRCAPDRITVIHHGFRPEPFRDATADATVLARYGIRQPFFLFVGRLQEKKNIGRIVEAFHRYLGETRTETQLVLLGMPDHGYERVSARIRELGLDRLVIRPGYTPREDMLSIMKAASVFVFPTLYEGFGFPILEGQAAGVPVLTSDCQPMREVGADGALYVDPRSVEAIAGGMHALASDEALRETLRERGFENCTRFSWDECAEKTLAVLKTTASS